MNSLSKPLNCEEIQMIQNFKEKALKLCRIITTKNKKYISYNDVSDELNIFIFMNNRFDETIGINYLFPFLADLKLLSVIKNNNGEKVSIQVKARNAREWLKLASQKIGNATIPEGYISDCRNIVDFVDRRGSYRFTTKERQLILNKLVYLQKWLNSQCHPFYKASETAKTLKDILFILTDFQGKGGFHQYIKKRFNIGSKDIFKNFIMSMLSKSNDFHKYNRNPDAFICYGIKTLINIFTTNDIKQFGFDQDPTEIVSILNSLKHSWRLQLISTI